MRFHPLPSRYSPMVLIAALTACGVPGTPPTGPGSYVVLADPTKSPEEVAAAVKAAGGTVTESLDGLGGVVVQAADPNFMQRLEADPGLNSAPLTASRPMLGRTVAAATSGDASFDATMPPKPGPEGEPFSGYQWGLDLGHVRTAWDAGYTGRGTVVAVLDSGIDATNQDLAPNLDLAHGRSFVPEEPDLVDRNGHGSHVAGIIAAAKNGYGIAGVAPEATLLPVKVLDATGQGNDYGIIRGIDYAVSQGASIINLSIEGLWEKDATGKRLRAAYASAIRHAQMRGAVVIVAAGNYGQQVPIEGSYVLPAEAGSGLVVGAVGPFNGENPEQFAFYSNYGNGYLNLVAPGGGMGFDPETFTPVVHKTDLVLSTWSTQALTHQDQGITFGAAHHMFLGGTSMATAYVSGVAALARSAHGPLKPSQMRQILLSATSKSIDPTYYGSGLIDAAKAVQSPSY